MKGVYFLFIVLLSVNFISCCWLGMKDKCECDPDNCQVAADTIYFNVEGISASNGSVIDLGADFIEIEGDFKAFNISKFKVIDYGYIVSSTTNLPTFENGQFDTITKLGPRGGPGFFTSKIIGLNDKTLYYVRLYLKTEDKLTLEVKYLYHQFSISAVTQIGECPGVVNINQQSSAFNSIKIKSKIINVNPGEIISYGHIMSSIPFNDLKYESGHYEFAIESNPTLILDPEFTFENEFSKVISGCSYEYRAFVNCKYGIKYGAIESCKSIDYSYLMLTSHPWKFEKLEYWDPQKKVLIDISDLCNSDDIYEFMDKDGNKILVSSTDQIPCSKYGTENITGWWSYANLCKRTRIRIYNSPFFDDFLSSLNPEGFTILNINDNICELKEYNIKDPDGEFIPYRLITFVK